MIKRRLRGFSTRKSGFYPLKSKDLAVSKWEKFKQKMHFNGKI
jgi:hypothetical protein